MNRNLYRLNRSPIRVYNALTRRLCIGYTIEYDNPQAPGGPKKIFVAGTWTKTAATLIARSMNQPKRKQRHDN